MDGSGSLANSEDHRFGSPHQQNRRPDDQFGPNNGPVPVQQRSEARREPKNLYCHSSFNQYTCSRREMRQRSGIGILLFVRETTGNVADE